MELPNNTYSSEAAKQMEFAEGFNPELTTEEKIRAAVEFDDLVQSTLLGYQVVLMHYIQMNQMLS